MDETQPTASPRGSAGNENIPEDTPKQNSISSKSSIAQQKNGKKSSIHSYKMSATPETLVQKEHVVLREDVFGRYTDENGTEHLIYRYTWQNRNKIQVQVINYGARVTSIRLPDRNGEIEDIVLGFDDIAGYLFYDKHYFGATIGRYANIISNSTFRHDNKNYIVSSNLNEHCFNGGFKGLDKAVWDTYMKEKKVIMSYVSPHMTDGFPGDLLVRITFELSNKNEFRINMDAQSTCPTILNLSNMLYFNLAGHHKGPDEIYRHMLTMNCNCFTPTFENGLPTSEIVNVINSPFDFQIPKKLGKVMGIVPKDGFNQNLCVNRGMYQEECFVGRLIHVPSGRMLEVYSNQPGVQLLTGNEFGHGQFKTMDELLSVQNESSKVEDIEDPVMLVYQKVHEKVTNLLNSDKGTNYGEIKNLLSKFNEIKKRQTNSSTNFLENGIELSSTQVEYLRKAREVVCENEETDDPCLDLKEALSNILKAVKVVESHHRESVGNLSGNGPMKSQDKNDVQVRNKSDIMNSKLDSTNLPRKKLNVLNSNHIPAIYKTSDVIRGKGGAVYKMHGGIALQTQNYPNAVNLKNFPPCELRPGDVYKHDIVYRFWIRAGNPQKWIKRNTATRQ